MLGALSNNLSQLIQYSDQRHSHSAASWTLWLRTTFLIAGLLHGFKFLGNWSDGEYWQIARING